MGRTARSTSLKEAIAHELRVMLWDRDPANEVDLPPAVGEVAERIVALIEGGEPMSERPVIYVHTDHNADPVRSFYEIPDALAALVRRGDERRTFTECLADLVEPAGDRGGVCGCGHSPQGPRGDES